MKHTSILILTAGSLGDAVLTLPTLQALATSGFVTVAGTAPYLDLGADLLGVERVIPLGVILGSGAPTGKFEEAFVFLKEDAALIANRLETGDFPIRVPPVSFQTFLNTSRSARFFWNAVVEQVRPGLLFPDRPSLHIPQEVRVNAEAFLRSLDMTSPLVVHPGSGGRAKNAPLSFFRQAADKTRKNPVLVTWGEAEENRLADIREAFGGLGHVRFLERPLPLRDLAAVLSLSRGYLGCDSGVTHLAAAAGAKVMAIFGPTDSRVWAPPGIDVLNAGSDFSLLGEVDFNTPLEAWLESL